MARTSRAERNRRRESALSLVSQGKGFSDGVTAQMSQWGCSRRTSLRDIEIAQSELVKALDSSEIQQMSAWLATQYLTLSRES